MGRALEALRRDAEEIDSQIKQNNSQTKNAKRSIEMLEEKRKLLIAAKADVVKAIEDIVTRSQEDAEEKKA